MAVPFAERKRRLLGLALHDGQGLRIEMQIELLAVRVNRIVDLDHAVVGTSTPCVTSWQRATAPRAGHAGAAPRAPH